MRFVKCDKESKMPYYNADRKPILYKTLVYLNLNAKFIEGHFALD